MKFTTKFKVWWQAYVSDYPFWRVTYQDGAKTHPLYYDEAYGLSKVFKGKLWIDYEYGANFGKSTL